MNKNEINKKVNDTLNSIENMEKTQPNPFMFERILNALDKKVVYKEQKSFIGKYALGFAVLFLLNIFSFFTYQNSVKDISNNTTKNTSTISEKTNKVTTTQQQSSTLKDFAKEYFSETDYNYNSK